MRLKHTLLFTGVATALAGITAVAAADRQPVHVVNVALSSGGIEQIRYTGNVAPRIVFRDEAAPYAAASFLDTAFGPDSPFAMMDRISVEMDRQMAGMIQQATMMQQMTPQQLQQAALASAPAGGTSSFTMISSSSGTGACSQSVRMVSLGDGKAPQVTRTSSGDCGSAVAKSSSLTPTALPAAKPAAPKLAPDTI